MSLSEKKTLIRKLEGYRLTEFQKKVLKVVLEIPKGQVRTYGQVAEMAGRPNAYRAVGTALRKNPLAPAIPCHRIIRSNRRIGNYSASGGKRKKLCLLKKEGIGNLKY
ncbi:MAG: MGMT family protein [Candidatus Marsarchaeota archaeon]|nr:MGMT family protein [Candidatus Marsarchaeota archaeon]MCL5413251.1 MGMT family protein [Candidatus Marsarchaeota archaeon]